MSWELDTIYTANEMPRRACGRKWSEVYLSQSRSSLNCRQFEHIQCLAVLFSKELQPLVGIIHPRVRACGLSSSAVKHIVLYISTSNQATSRPSTMIARGIFLHGSRQSIPSQKCSLHTRRCHVSSFWPDHTEIYLWKHSTSTNQWVPNELLLYARIKTAVCCLS